MEILLGEFGFAKRNELSSYIEIKHSYSNYFSMFSPYDYLTWIRRVNLA